MEREALSAVIGPRLARQGRGDPEAGQHGVIEAVIALTRLPERVKTSTPVTRATPDR
jgi:hypothetical protein